LIACTIDSSTIVNRRIIAYKNGLRGKGKMAAKIGVAELPPEYPGEITVTESNPPDIIILNLPPIRFTRCSRVRGEVSL